MFWGVQGCAEDGMLRACRGMVRCWNVQTMGSGGQH